MATLQETLLARSQRSDQLQMLGNLTLVVASHLEMPNEPSRADEHALRTFQANSSMPRRQLAVDRSVHEQASNHGLRLAQLVDFVGSEVVVDFGAGQSAFLDSFEEASTIAVDQDERMRDFQERKGHPATNDIDQLPDRTARLINDSFASYWLPSSHDVDTTATAIKRVMSRDGLLLTGSIFADRYHLHCEHALGLSSVGIDFNPPYLAEQNPLERNLAYLRMRFVANFLFDKDFMITGTRATYANSEDYRNFVKPEDQLPNFLQIQKA